MKLHRYGGGESLKAAWPLEEGQINSSAFITGDEVKKIFYLITFSVKLRHQNNSSNLHYIYFFRAKPIGEIQSKNILPTAKELF